MYTTRMSTLHTVQQSIHKKLYYIYSMGIHTNAATVLLYTVCVYVYMYSILD